MLWKGYKATIITGLITVIGWVVLMGHLLFNLGASSFGPNWYIALIIDAISAAILFLLIRGTLLHRPINPSSVAFCGDAMVNTLPLNSLYNVLYAIYCLKNERSAQQAYRRDD